MIQKEDSIKVDVAEALMDLKKVDLNQLPPGKTKKDICLEKLEKSIRKWSFDPSYKRIFGEYGIMFKKWLNGTADPNWKSFGNGSAMRVGSAGWLYDSLEETIEMAAEGRAEERSRSSEAREGHHWTDIHHKLTGRTIP